MKTLIVCYSLTANNLTLAAALQKRLDADLLRLETTRPLTRFSIYMAMLFNRLPKLKPYSVNISQYNRVILIAPVWGGQIAKPLKSFLTAERSNLESYSYITVCGGLAGQRANLERELAQCAKKEPDCVTELWVSDLIKRRGDIRQMLQYRLTESDLLLFEEKIQKFISKAAPNEDTHLSSSPVISNLSRSADASHVVMS
ncbi:MAG: flavodoxin family protein [Bacteroidota bacterium]